MKRKLSRSEPHYADAIQRQLCYSRSSEGRGALSGWVTCPLCAGVSNKKFALGRGIANHLLSVHAPWNPGKAEIKKRRRLLQRKERERRQQGETAAEADASDAVPDDREVVLSCDPWEPTEREIEEWSNRVVEIVRSLEDCAAAAAVPAASAAADAPDRGESSRTSGVAALAASAGAISVVAFVAAGKDRTGRETAEYRESLPNFLQASADGDLAFLKRMVDDASTRGGDEAVRDLLGTKDRNLSTCEHWAAGSGHLDCLRYLVETRKSLSLAPVSADDDTPAPPAAKRRKVRRRDGKTALHFAARNGHVDCIRYLLKENLCQVDEASGDGTTPLHLACFGGQVETFDLLLERGADVARTNDWGCSVAHWMGMTRSESKENVRQLCNRIVQHGVSFVEQQKQGHTALHKAAQRKNRNVIEWMASPLDEGGAGLSEEDRRLAARPDVGGHTPGDIWRSVQGDVQFGEWMQKERLW
jgi:Ankyrin repeats (3 copies)